MKKEFNDFDEEEEIEEEWEFEKEEEAQKFLDAQFTSISRFADEDYANYLPLWATNILPVLRDIALSFLGYQIVPKHKDGKIIWVVRKRKGLIPERALIKIIALMKPYINPAVVLSDLSPHDVYELTYKFSETLFFFLIDEGLKKEGINIKIIPQILHTFSNFVYSVLKRAEYGEERKLFYTRVEITLSGEIQENKNKKIKEILKKI